MSYQAGRVSFLKKNKARGFRSGNDIPGSQIQYTPWHAPRDVIPELRPGCFPFSSKCCFAFFDAKRVRRLDTCALPSGHDDRGGILNGTGHVFERDLNGKRAENVS